MYIIKPLVTSWRSSFLTVADALPLPFELAPVAAVLAFAFVTLDTCDVRLDPESAVRSDAQEKNYQSLTTPVTPPNTTQ